MNCVHNLQVMDSPGLFDTERTHEEVAVDVAKAVASIHPGPTAILYVVAICNRYTEEEKGVYDRLKVLFDSEVTEHMIIVFTRGDDLKRQNKTIHEVLSSAPKFLSSVLQECGRRYVVFDNTAKDKKQQVTDLLNMVKNLSKRNGGRPYKCPKYGDVSRQVEEEVARRLQLIEKKELKEKKYVQNLEHVTKNAEDEVKETRRQLERAEKERAEEMRKKSQERDEQLKAMIEILNQQRQLSADQIREKEIEYKHLMEKKWMEEMNRIKDQSRREMAVQQHRENIANALLFLTLNCEMTRQQLHAQRNEAVLAKLKSDFDKSQEKSCVVM